MYVSSFVRILRQEARKQSSFCFSNRLYGESDMRVLNVAEKNDAAKNIAALLSDGTATQRKGLSKYCKIYEFEYKVFGQKSRMIMTSVSGHIFQYEFPGIYRNWKGQNPIMLFEAPVQKILRSDDCKGIVNSLQKEIKMCSKLIIWTDCDREGENIGFEIIEICKEAKRNIQIFRAIFSDITAESVKRAIANLEEPKKFISDAVDVRQELDLRIGAAFTRFQTLYLRKAFPDVLGDNLVSYGSCQFPTLGFVVERFQAVMEFKPENFWLISVKHRINETSVDFKWGRCRLFNKLACEVLYKKCEENGTAVVENVETKPKVKYRPKPLDTTVLQKLSSRMFKLSAKETLRVAEALYCRGLISYPRTETNRFSKDIDLVSLVSCQTQDPHWGGFAEEIMRDGPNPFQGNKSDQAHPPIHPTKYTTELGGTEKVIYEFIVRHFLACLSKHAEGLETVVSADLAGEKFSAKGLIITARNYLEVYPYEKWNDKEIHLYQKGEVFTPQILMEEGETSPPELLTEADLISLMEKHGIGTDATHAEHIETIKARMYVGLQDKYFVPRTLGMSLVEGYNNMGCALARPEMRAELEMDLKRLCDKQITPAEVLLRHIEKYKNLYETVQGQMFHLTRAVQSFIQVEPAPVELEEMTSNDLETVGKCPTCQSDLLLKSKKTGGKYIGCSAFPKCRVALWFPSFVLDVFKTMDTCAVCGPSHYLLRFKFQRGSCYFPPDHIGCIGGCDWNLLEVLNCSTLNRNTPLAGTRAVTMPLSVQEINDSGFVSPKERSSLGFVLGASPPKCHCGVPASCTTVKKFGPTQGREYYRCGAVRGSVRCDFFQFKSEKDKNETNVNRRPAGDDEPMRCYCSIPCRSVVSRKEGPNKGRTFLACGKHFQDPSKCNFFKWVDNDENEEMLNGITRFQGNRYRGPRE